MPYPQARLIFLQDDSLSGIPMATAVVSHRRLEAADRCNGNAEAGPSRRPNGLIVDHSVVDLSRLRLVPENAVSDDALLDYVPNPAYDRTTALPTFSQRLRVIEVDEEDTQHRAGDRKGKAPVRPKKFSCSWENCEKSFFKTAKLREHELSHTGERPHICADCGASYIRASHLSAHARTHQSPEEKSFQCMHEACGKRFWTAQHLSRHEKLHQVPLEYECPHCEQAFAKHHQLRTHVAIAHAPAGTKPFQCTFPTCTWSFTTSQKLRVHQKTHDEARYMCSHDVHGEQGVVFGTWSALRAHIKAEHPPKCPFVDCKGRTFKSTKNLREHLKIHAEHGDDLQLWKSHAQQVDVPQQQAEIEGNRRGPGNSESDEHDLSDSSYVPECLSKRKRKRRDSAASTLSPEGEGVKKLKRSSSEFGKEFGCEELGCSKRFKTRRALSVHHQTAHLNLRPFACPHPGCDSSYGHKHLLQRHISARHRIPPAEETLPRNTISMGHELPPQPVTDNVVNLLTGLHTIDTALLEKRPLLCPCESVDAFNRCRHRFGRLYDLRRHIKKHHGLIITEEEARVMLKDANKASRGSSTRPDGQVNFVTLS